MNDNNADMRDNFTDDVEGRRFSVTKPEDTGGLELDRRHAVLLRDDAAANMKDALGRTTREGVRLVRTAKAGDVFELVPSKELAEGLRSGTLRAAAPASGDASVLVKNVKDGRIAGRSDLRQVKPSAAKLLGPAAWQALALATQQHYLVEITSKLEDIQAGVDEVLDVLKDNRVGTLRHLAELVRDAQATSRREGDLSSTRVAELQTAARQAKELWHQIATTARRHLAHYEAGKTPADDVEETFAMLMQATHVLAMCSDALVALPHHSEADLRSCR